MNRLVVALVACVALLGCDRSASAAEGLEVTVTRVVDGDTVYVTDVRGTVVKVRILGVDSPETHKPSTPVQCWGPEATAFAEATLLGQPVRVVGDPTQDAQDRFGRSLAYLYLRDGSNYSVLATTAGAARSYVYDRRPVVEYAAILTGEVEARTAGRGMWGRCAT